MERRDGGGAEGVQLGTLVPQLLFQLVTELEFLGVGRGGAEVHQLQLQLRVNEGPVASEEVRLEVRLRVKRLGAAWGKALPEGEYTRRLGPQLLFQPWSSCTRLLAA